MKNILEEIVDRKRVEVEFSKKDFPIERLKDFQYYGRSINSINSSLLDATKTGIISEFKRSSPSLGSINANASLEKVIRAYDTFGASGISVLTDHQFFGGSSQDLIKARSLTNLPLLRKDFIVDPYQIYESKAWGADVILLIAAVLSMYEIENYAELAQNLGLSVLLEIHNEDELPKNLINSINIIGVNNRNLKDFKVDVNTSIKLYEKINPAYLRISESGISSVDTIKSLKEVGYNGFLIGECFMKEKSPESAFKQFVDELKG